ERWSEEEDPLGSAQVARGSRYVIVYHYVLAALGRHAIPTLHYGFHMPDNPTLLGAAIRFALMGATLCAAPALASDTVDPQTGGDLHVTDLRPIQVIGIAEDPNRIASPHSVVSGEDVVSSGAATLGEALSGQPGVHADTFGAGSSRPVIRGQVGPRVKVLSDSAS